jgi:hypothetical protein
MSDENLLMYLVVLLLLLPTTEACRNAGIHIRLPIAEARFYF